MLPSEVRRKPKNASFDSREPTSPKVSCMGQVRFSNKKKRTKPIKPVISLPGNTVQVSCPKDEVKMKKPPEINIIKGPKEGGKSDVFYDDTMVSNQAVPSLGKIKRFSSARGALSNFDWRIHDAVVVPDCQDGRLNVEKDSKGNKFTERDFLHRIPAFSSYKYMSHT
nr:uncharacterized protein CFP56_44958 [Quercus suber]